MPESLAYPFRIAAVLALAWAVAGPAGAQNLDHYNVYQAIGPQPPAVFQPVNVADQFGATVTVLGDANLFLVPAIKNGEGPLIDPASHLTCYPTFDPLVPPAQVIATHQFGPQLLNLQPAAWLCVPSDKLLDGVVDPINLDHYLCYPAAGNPLQIPVGIQDQFQQQGVNLLDPSMFCTPADKNGEGIQNPLDHLACYNYQPLGPVVLPPVPITNQFFPAPVDLEVREASGLCLPAQKEIVEPGLDHFTVYRTLQPAPDGPLVQIRDQWQDQVTDLGPVDLFMVPADKNQEGINDPFSHLACNLILDGDPGPPVVWAINQFGEQQLAIGVPRELCVPTEKLIAPGPVDLDHYKCYEAFGQALVAPANVVDQFFPAGAGGDSVLLDPFLFCNPADKNGEGIQNPDDHLACFNLDPPLQGPLQIPIQNQFYPPGPLPTQIDLNQRFAFCVPSCKDSDGDGECDENDNCPNVPIPSPDTDGDGIGDLCDPCIFFDNSIAGGLVDTDGDLIPDVCQCCDANMNGFLDNGDLSTIFQCITNVLPPATCAAILASGKGTCNNNGLFDNNDLTQLFLTLSAIQPSSVLTCPNRPEGTPVP